MSGLRPALTVWAIAALIAGCSRPAPPPPARESDAPPPSVQDAPAPADGSADEAASAGSEPDGTDLSRLAPDVRACLSEKTLEDNRGRTYYEVDRADGENGAFVYVATVEPDDRAAEVESALLLFQPDGTCLSMLDLDGVFWSFEEAAADDVEADLAAAYDRWVLAWQRGETP